MRVGRDPHVWNPVYFCQFIISGERNIRIPFCPYSDKATPHTPWANLMIWIVNISRTVTGWTDYKVMFRRIENLFVHFPPRARADEHMTHHSFKSLPFYLNKMDTIHIRSVAYSFPSPIQNRLLCNSF